MIRSKIVGIGSYLPPRVLTNSDLEKMVDTSDAWITERTGIKSRHIAADNEYTSDLAVRAALKALENAGMAAEDLDMIILATTTPDETLPATATKVQKALEMTHGFAFDIQAVCSGFMFALATADNYIRAGSVRRVLVIGAETLSKIVDWTDRNTCVLFGDGAGAVILEASEGNGTSKDTGVLATALRSDGTYHDLLKTTGGPSTTGMAGHIYMEGREVFRHAVTNLADIARRVMVDAGVESQDIDCLVPHQANSRIIEGTAKKLSMPMQKVVLSLPTHGNTSAASIPLALDFGVKSGQIKKGDLLLLESMGGGFTWAGSLVRL